MDLAVWLVYCFQPDTLCHIVVLECYRSTGIKVQILVGTLSCTVHDFFLFTQENVLKSFENEFDLTRFTQISDIAIINKEVQFEGQKSIQK